MRRKTTADVDTAVTALSRAMDAAIEALEALDAEALRRLPGYPRNELKHLPIAIAALRSHVRDLTDDDDVQT